MHDELSIADLEGELCAELPTRNMMRRRRLHFIKKSFHRFNACDCRCSGDFSTFGRFDDGFGRFDDGFSRASAFAAFGSAANANATFQSNFNPQIAIGGGGSISSLNSNFNATSQFAAPINFGF